MSQLSPFTIPTSGPNSASTVTAAVLAALNANRSQNSGPAAPSDTVAFMAWLSTLDTDLAELMLRNGANTAWDRIYAQRSSDGEVFPARALIEEREFSTSQTVTKNPLARFWQAHLIGASGASSGAAVTSANTQCFGLAGNPGDEIITPLTEYASGVDTLTIAIGVGGAAVDGNIGSNGTATTLDYNSVNWSAAGGARGLRFGPTSASIFRGSEEANSGSTGTGTTISRGPTAFGMMNAGTEGTLSSFASHGAGSSRGAGGISASLSGISSQAGRAGARGLAPGAAPGGSVAISKSGVAVSVAGAQGEDGIIILREYA